MNVVLKKLKLAGLVTAFMGALEIFNPGWQGAVTLVPSGKSIEDYAWLGDVSQMDEWNDELIPRGLTEFNYTIRNKRFGSALKLYNDDLADDQYGQTKVRVGDLAEKAKAYPAVLLRSLRANGHTALCYDGQPFFSTAHVEGDSGTQSNLVTGTGTTTAQIQADFKSARAKMFAFKTDKGDPIARANPHLVVVCAPDIEIPIREALMAPTVAAGGVNVIAGMVKDVEVDPGLTGNSWYLEDRAPKVKAYIIQERDKVTASHTLPGSDMDILQDATVFRAKWRGNGGYGLWQHAVKVSNA